VGTNVSFGGLVPARSPSLAKSSLKSPVDQWRRSHMESFGHVLHISEFTLLQKAHFQLCTADSRISSVLSDRDKWKRGDWFLNRFFVKFAERTYVPISVSSAFLVCFKLHSSTAYFGQNSNAGRIHCRYKTVLLLTGCQGKTLKRGRNFSSFL